VTNHEKIKQAFCQLKAPANMADRVMEKAGANGNTWQALRARKLLLLVATVTLSLGLATVVFAVVGRMVERADTGGTEVLVIAQDKNQISSSYWDEAYDANAGWAAPYNFLAYGLLEFDDETAAKINAQLDSMFFDAAGNPVKASIVPSTGGKGYVFHTTNTSQYYNIDHNRVFGIRWNSDKQEIELQVSAEVIETSYALMADSYEEAAALMGCDFILPDITGFSAKTFQFMFDSERQRNAIYVIYTNETDQIIHYYAENTRQGNETPPEWRVTGMIEEVVINGFTVYKQMDADGEWGRNIWQNGELSYCLFYARLFNIPYGEYDSIIENMLR
jgi:hypothetical protein